MNVKLLLYLKITAILFFLATMGMQITTVFAQGTAFTYQGRLNASASPANGNYDFRFKLFSDPLGDNQVGTTQLTNAVSVTNGLFVATIDFGSGIFTGGNYWLLVGVRTNTGGSGTYTDLSPLQPVTPSPYSIMANSASNLLGTLPAGQVSGTLGNAQLANSSITVNVGTGLSGGGAVTLGGSTTLNNTGVLSVTGNSDITATTVGGAVTLGSDATIAATPNTIVKRDGTGSFSATNIVLGGFLTLPIGNGIYAGSTNDTALISGFNDNYFAGFDAGNFAVTGVHNTGMGGYALNGVSTGNDNVALGFGALFETSTGGNNTAVGNYALEFNTNGAANSAVGFSALFSNTTGNENTAIGAAALENNTTGNNNIAVGYQALASNQSGSDNTALGWSALENIKIGSENVAIGFQALGNLELTSQRSVGNIALGANVGLNLLAGTNNIYIGYTGAAGNENNAIRIGTTGVQTNTFIAGVITGNGGGLANLDASQLTGSIADARLSANVALLNAVQSFTARNSFTGGLSIDTTATTDGNFNINTNTYLFSHAIYLRGESGTDHNHGLAYCGPGVTNFAPTVLPDGPVLWGFGGGALGTSSGNNAVLTWNSTGVSITPGSTALSLYVNGNRTGGWPNPVSYIENLSAATNASPALRLLVDGGHTPDGALSVSANVSGTASNSIIAEFGNSGTFVCIITNDGSIFSSGNIFAQGNITNNGSIYSAGNVYAGGITTTNIVLNGFLTLPFGKGINADTNGDTLLINGFNGNFFVGPDAGNFTVSVAHNTGVGEFSLNAVSSGPENTAVGYSALEFDTLGQANTAVGAFALNSNTNGNSNVAIGDAALENNVTGSGNVAIGNGALGQLENSSPGQNNIAIGTSAGLNLTGGSQNIYIGNLGINATENNTIRIGSPGTQTNTVIAGLINGNGGGLTNLSATQLVGGSNTNLFVGARTGNLTMTGYQNVGIGQGSLSNNTVGAQNTGYGYGTLVANTSGNDNAAFGTASLSFNTIGSLNSAAGAFALAFNTTGSGNTALGYTALSNNTNGNNNTAVGNQALLLNTSGSANTALGVNALPNNGTGNNNIAIGQNALNYNIGGNNNVAVGLYALANLEVFSAKGTNNIALGNFAGTNLTFGSSNLYLGSPGGAGIENNSIRIGDTNVHTNTTIAGVINGNGGGLTNLSGQQIALLPHDNFIVGPSAGNLNMISGQNTGFGELTLRFNTNGFHNSAFGYQALENNTNGFENTAIGWTAMLDNQSGNSNTAVGVGALGICATGNNNIAIGDGAGANLITGSSNIYIGSPAGISSENGFIRIGTPGVHVNTLIAGNITGNGSLLTSLPAGNLVGSLPAISGASLTSLTAGNLTGTVADARLSANVPLLNGTQTFSGVNTFTNGFTVNTSAGTVQFISESGLVPGITAGNSGGNSGHLRFRNALEVWPNSGQTASGFVDVRSTNGSATVSLNGANGAIICSNVTASGVLLTSDRNMKENFKAINAADVLAKVASLPITEWQYKAEERGMRHIGPMAQDFHAAFGLDGSDDKHISVVDEGGVALAAIQGLNQKLDEKDAEIAALRREVTAEKELSARMEARFTALENAIKQIPPNSTTER